jgi:hypothetical protein
MIVTLPPKVWQLSAGASFAKLVLHSSADFPSEEFNNNFELRRQFSS